MPTDPALMQMMSGGAPSAPGAAPAGGPSSPPTGGAAPAGGPMSTPQPKAGQNQAAMISIEMSVRLLEDAMSKFDFGSDEKQTVSKAHNMLVTKFGQAREKASELIPAEMIALQQAMPGFKGGAPAPQGAPAGAQMQ